MIKGEVFLNLFILALGLFCIDHFFTPDYSGKIFISIVLILSLLYIFIRLLIYYHMVGGENKYLRPNILPKFGEGFLPQWPDEEERHHSHNYQKVEIPLVLQFMPLFFIAFVINKTVFATYIKAKDWSNNYLTIKLNKDGN